MIVDSTMFNDELDMLELRLNIMGDYVDYFVVVESDHTHTNIPKPYNLHNNIDRFSKWHNKLVYVKIRSQLRENPWGNEHYARLSMSEAWRHLNLSDNDLLLYSDLDEIFRPEAIEYAMRTNYNFYGMIMPVSYYKFNYVDVLSDKIGYVAWGCAYRGYQNHNPIYLRKPSRWINDNIVYLHHAGWHFSWIGEKEELNRKLMSICHTELNKLELFKNLTDVDQLIATNRDHIDHRPKWRVVNLDNYFPKYLVDNKEKYAQHILPDSGETVRQYYPFEMLQHWLP